MPIINMIEDIICTDITIRFVFLCDQYNYIKILKKNDIYFILLSRFVIFTVLINLFRLIIFRFCFFVWFNA